MSHAFYGRKNELKTLKDKIFTIRPDFFHGTSSICLTGPPGIGKQTLLTEARRIFEDQGHPGVFLVERNFLYSDTYNVFLNDLLQKLQTAFTVDIPGIRPFCTDVQFEELRSSFENRRNTPEEAASVFKTVMKTCMKMNVRTVLLLYSFEKVKVLNPTERKGIFGFLDSISSRNDPKYYLNILLVSDMQPQFVVHKDISGSLFQDGYQPIVLHNFNTEDINCYFADFPGGTPDSAVCDSVLRYCGRFPKFLSDFYENMSNHKRITEEDVFSFVNESSRNDFYHRLYTLLSCQYIDGADTVSALDIFRKYFLKNDNRQKSLMRDIYILGLVDKRPDGRYTPLTEYSDIEHVAESSFLAYLKREEALLTSVVRQTDAFADSQDIVTSWLHLSDLHVPAAAMEFVETKTILMEFEGLARKIHPEFMIVTGDFRDKNSGTDFNAARDYLLHIMEYFGISKEDVYLVPGNHDVEDATAAQTRTITSIIRNMESSHHCNQEYLKKLYGRFSAFDSFFKDFYGDVFCPGEDLRRDKPSGTHLLVWQGKQVKINILCANTALLSDGRRNKDGSRAHSEIADLVGMIKALEMRDNDSPTIMIGHHGIDSLFEPHQKQIANLFQKFKISAYLHGDGHKNSGARGPQLSIGCSCPSIECGQSVPKPGDNYSDVGAVYYEWRRNQKVYVRYFHWIEDEYGIWKLRKATQFEREIGVDDSFTMLK